LDEIPVYVGTSAEGIRARVRRHLTSARSDVIANRQIDVWEIAFVWAYPEADKLKRKELEALLYHYFNPQSALMNGTVPQVVDASSIPAPFQKIQVMVQSEIDDKKDHALRLPRQAGRYFELVEHFIAVKNSDQIGRAMDAHFVRLARYHKQMLASAVEEED
jgi:hypothetical protein